MDSSTTIRLAELAVADQQKRTVDRCISEADFADEALIAKVCLGSREALAILFRRYAGLVRRVALRVLKDASEADDLVQDVFILIHRLCRTFDGSRGSAHFWILQMAFRRAVSRRRYLSARHFYKHVELEESSVHGELRATSSDDSTAQVLEALDLRRVFETLSDDQQRTLRLHFIEGYTLDEIATMLGQTKGNIRHHSFRGLERLRKLIFAGKLPGARAV